MGVNKSLLEPYIQPGRNFGPSVLLREFEGFKDEPVSVVEDVVSLGKSMGLKVDDDDMEELIEDHDTELTT